VALIEHFAGLYCISACCWLLLGLYSIFSIKKFIVRRYEKETDLLNTVFFKEHFAFARYQPDFLSSGLCAAHLLICVWGWRFYGKRKILRDIDSPQSVTQYFSKKEIARVKGAVFVIMVIILHLIGFEVIDWIWPSLFD
jgi:hypothetical protein